jgi:hypothetical protein
MGNLQCSGMTAIRRRFSDHEHGILDPGRHRHFPGAFPRFRRRLSHLEKLSANASQDALVSSSGRADTNTPNLLSLALGRSKRLRVQTSSCKKQDGASGNSRDMVREDRISAVLHC